MKIYHVKTKESYQTAPMNEIISNSRGGKKKEEEQKKD